MPGSASVFTEKVKVHFCPSTLVPNSEKSPFVIALINGVLSHLFQVICEKPKIRVDYSIFTFLFQSKTKVLQLEDKVLIIPLMDEKNKKTNEDIFPVDENDTDVMVTLDLDDGTTLDCEILTIFDIGPQSYIVLLPVDENGTPYDYENVVIYRYFEKEDGEPYLDNIKDDDEYERVAKRFQELQDIEEKKQAGS